jgi:hypothetical protein
MQRISKRSSFRAVRWAVRWVAPEEARIPSGGESPYSVIGGLS